MLFRSESVVPSSGQLGTVVTITGTSLLAGASSIVSATLAGATIQEVISSSNTVLVVVAGTNGSDTVGGISYIADSGATVSSSNTSLWTYIDAGDILDVDPVDGRAGTVVTITGTGLLGGGNSISSVTLAEESATVVSGNDTHIIAVAPSSAINGTSDVVIVADSGATTILEDGWTYVFSGIEFVEPNSGQLNTLITITGGSGAMTMGGSARNVAPAA